MLSLKTENENLASIYKYYVVNLLYKNLDLIIKILLSERLDKGFKVKEFNSIVVNGIYNKHIGLVTKEIGAITTIEVNDSYDEIMKKIIMK